MILYLCNNHTFINTDDTDLVLNFSQLDCAGRGSHILPIKDAGLFAFVGTWAAKVVPVDIWVGLRTTTVMHKYDANEPLRPLIEELMPVLTYSDGTAFNVNNGYTLGATKLSGECLYLKQSSSYSVMDSKCNKIKAFICKWSSKYKY